MVFAIEPAYQSPGIARSLKGVWAFIWVTLCENLQYAVAHYLAKELQFSDLWQQLNNKNACRIFSCSLR